MSYIFNPFTGKLQYVPPVSPGGSGGHTIQEEGSSLAQRTKLNFIGASVTVTDNSGADSTDVTITPGGESSPDYKTNFIFMGA